METFDKNKIIGIVLMIAIFVGFTIYMRPSKEQLEQQRRYRDSLVQVQNELLKQEAARHAADSAKLAQSQLFSDTLSATDSTQKAMYISSFGDFANCAEGTSEQLVLENNLLRITLLSKGAQISSVQVKGYKTHEGDSLFVQNNDIANVMNLDFFNGNKSISTKNLFFKTVSANKSGVVFRAYVDTERWLEFSYLLPEDSYLVDFTIAFHNLKGLIKQNSSFLDFTWSQFLPILERGNDWEAQNTGLYYKYDSDDVENLVVSDKELSESLKSSTKWIAYKGQFFSSVIISKSSFPNALVNAKKTALNNNQLFLSSIISIPNNIEQVSCDSMAFYFGPNKYSILSRIEVGNTSASDLELSKLINLGWGIFAWVNRWAIIPLFNFLGSFLSDYGLIILIMTVIIKLVLFPLTYKSYKSSASMRVLKPMVDEINKKYPKQEQAMQKQQAVMDFYKRAGVSPMGGCLPALLQMPILIAMFRFFPASIELRQQSFLWATDLSSYDSILDLPFSIPFYGDHVSLFTLLMALGIVVSTKLNSAQMDSNQMPGMKLMLYLMPIFMIGWFNNYSSGLSYYYFLSNIITIIQTLVIRKFFIDEKALLEKIKTKTSENNAKTPKKKSGFLARLEEAQRRQLEQMKKQQKRK